MKGGRYVGCFVLFTLSGAAGAVHGTAAVRDTEADRMLTDRLNDTLAKMDRMKGQERAVTGRAKIDLSTCEITADITASFLPEVNSERLVEQLQTIDNGLWWTSRSLGCEGGTKFLFNGKPVEHFFPPEEVPSKLKHGIRVPRAQPLTVVSAGHGAYLHHENGEWRYQREEHNGIIEDELTPLLVDELQRYVRERSEHEVRRVRSTSSHAHELADRPWWQMAARYNLQETLPEQPEIWNSLPTATHGLREYDEDIRSRPLYANHLNATGLISVHTNAFESDPRVRGARVYIHPQSPQNAALARNMLCYMKEIITAQPDYEGFPVAPHPHELDHGENRLAAMPAVVVEAAFHTNVDDALALQDPVFRTAAMKGVEKGYRLHREGKGCAPLSLKPIADIAVDSWSSEDVPLEFDGYPQYPVVAVTTAQSCPEGWECREGKTTQGDASWPIKATLRCENSNPGRIVWQTQLIDDDGVRSKPVTHAVDCGGAG